MEHVRNHSHTATPLPRSIPAQHRANPVDHAPVQRHPTPLPRPAPRLPRVPVQLPLPILRRHSLQLHPTAQPGSQCLPALHEATGPTDTQP